jgi:sulfopyruvate decarboxylase subunit alpha
VDATVAALVLEGLKRARVGLVVGLPDSLLNHLYKAAEDASEPRYVQVGNEAEGAAVAAGAWMVGMSSVLIMENSGLRSACEALARLGLASGVPVTMLMGYRGDVGERFVYGINHGITMEPLLKAMRIPHLMIDREEDVVPAVIRGVTHAVSSLYHVAVILRDPLV